MESFIQATPIWDIKGDKFIKSAFLTLLKMNKMKHNFLTFLILGITIIILGCSLKNKNLSLPNIKKNVTKTDINWSKADSLLALMTLTEKLGQLQQLDGGISKKELPRLIEEGRVGSVLNEVNPKLIAKYQKIALEKSRLGIPLLIGRDVIHGFRTMFPIPLAQSASWNMDLVEEGAKIAAKEASAIGVNWTFAPMIDVGRDPRWGRIAESPGEDVYLTSEVGVAMIKGFQGAGNYKEGNIAACAKHFAAYGLAEGGRDYNTAIVGERQLREIYLRPFLAAVENDVMSFMTSFNEVNDIPASGNRFLLKQVLREEWEYKGVVVSDWESVKEMIAHGYCKDLKEAGYKAMHAGLDMEMVSTSYNDYLEVLMSEGKIDIKQIDAAVRRILWIKIRLGLFENPYPNKEEAANTLSDKHLEIAKQAAIESAVLLKNDNGILPISDKIKSVAVIGPLADAPHEQMGTWAFDGKKADSKTPLKALQTMLGGNVKVNYAVGLKVSRTKNNDGFKAALEAANQSDVVLYFVGEESILSGEAHCRAHLNLPGKQEALLEELSKTGKKIVLVVMAGRPLILTNLLPKVDAVLYAWHGGTMAGPAIANILIGKANPSGKLPITFPRAVGQIPIYHAHKNTGRPANESNWVSIDKIPVEAWQTSLGNTSHYIDEGFKPLFPFGYGLSYTSFDYKNLRISKNKMTNAESLLAEVEVTNTGKYDGKEVVQLYIQDLFGSVTRPVKELKGFQKVELKAGVTKTVRFEISANDLNFYNADMEFLTETGGFKLWIGEHADCSDFVAFEVVKEVE
ncbi:MAG: glycoside hydrolase family 3 N-terminal domain-containing protein [Saprospiraceae bacterium]